MDIILKGIEKRYHNGKSVLEYADYTFGTGIYVLKGSSGIGKSALLNIISGYCMPSKGEVVRNGIRKIAYVMQDALLFTNLTIAENMMVMSPDNGNIELLKTKLWDLGLDEDVISKCPANLSGGQVKKTELLLHTISNNFDALLLDEPVSNLDDESICHVIKYIESIHNKIILIASHINLQFEKPNTILEIVKGELREKNG